MGKWTQEIIWSELDGSRQCVGITGEEGQPLEEVIALAIESAKKHGWQPAKWWQWWRWHDTRLPDTAC